jgi:hypothetical protein
VAGRVTDALRFCSEMVTAGTPLDGEFLPRRDPATA